MKHLASVLSAMYPAAHPLSDYRVQDDGAGPYLKHWDAEKLGPVPTQEEIDAITDEALAADRQAKAEIRALEEASGFTRRQREFLKASVPAAAELDSQIAAKRIGLLGKGG